MCLNRQGLSAYNPPIPAEINAYKAFKIEEKNAHVNTDKMPKGTFKTVSLPTNITFLVMDRDDSSGVGILEHLDQFVKAKGSMDIGGYTEGFHCFMTEEDAKRYTRNQGWRTVILKVKVKDITALGTQDSATGAVVAREMMVPKKAYKQALIKAQTQARENSGI